VFGPRIITSPRPQVGFVRTKDFLCLLNRPDYTKKKKKKKKKKKLNKIKKIKIKKKKKKTPPPN